MSPQPNSPKRDAKRKARREKREQGRKPQPRKRWRRVSLSGPMIDHLLRLLDANEESGEYYGPRAMYWARHSAIVQRLESEQPFPEASQKEGGES